MILDNDEAQFLRDIITAYRVGTPASAMWHELNVAGDILGEGKSLQEKIDESRAKAAAKLIANGAA